MSLTNEDKDWINAQLERFEAKLERVETTLLAEFHKWASPIEIAIPRPSERVAKLEPPPH